MSRLSRLLLVSTALVAAAPAMAQDGPLGPVDYLGEVVLPTGLLIGGVPFGGISGIDYDAAADLFYAIADDRASNGPARFYVLKLAVDGEGVHAVDVVEMRTLTLQDGTAFAPNTLDGEAIRFDAASQHLFWSSERNTAGVPQLFEATLDGNVVREIAVPAYHLPNADQTVGGRGNLTYEGLTLAGDGSMLVSLESALVQDGPIATLDAGTVSRITRYDIATGAVTAEYAYRTDPIFIRTPVEGGFNDTGVTEILALDAETLLVMERSFASGIGNEINVYEVSLAGAADVAGTPVLAADVAVLDKTLVVTLAEGDFGGMDVDNVEGLSFGPIVGGRRTLVFTSDNNFSADQFTQFVVFAFGESM